MGILKLIMEESYPGSQFRIDWEHYAKVLLAKAKQKIENQIKKQKQYV